MGSETTVKACEVTKKWIQTQQTILYTVLKFLDLILYSVEGSEENGGVSVQIHNCSHVQNKNRNRN